MANPPNGQVQSVQRALRILSLFTPQRPEWSVGGISRELGISKSVVSRLLSTMARESFVVQDSATKGYSVGPQAFAVGSTFKPYIALEKILRAEMEQLARDSGHSTSAGVPSGSVFTVISTVQGTASVRVAFEIGQRPYYHAAAIGKLLLAHMPVSLVLEIIGPNPLRKLTQHTIGTVEELLDELAHIRQVGIAISRQETYIGVGAVAAGIITSTGECIAAISIVYPIHLVSDEEVRALAFLTKSSAERISAQLSSTSFRVEDHHRPVEDAAEIMPF